MKNLLTIIMILFILSCSNNNNKKITEHVSANNLDWLLGKWVRINDNVGKQTFENWEKIDSTNYIGLGCTLENSDTTFKENLKLTKINNIWRLEVSGVNSEMIPFTFINQTDSNFICENKLNEFPKRIEYLIKNKNLIAKISADSTEITFEFKKLDN